MSVYYTVFTNKSMSVRNNVKNSMIKNFMHSLNESIDDRATSITHIHSAVYVFTIPQYDKSDVDPLTVYNKNKSIPCLNLNCRWIEYLSTFYPTMDLWQLPSYTDLGMCVICDMQRKRTLDISRIVVSKNHSVSFSVDRVNE